MPILIHIDTSRRGTITEQIVKGIQRLVDEHELLGGTRLPSIRRFASAHGVSTFTVVQAYDRLVASGHIQSRPCRGFFVEKPLRPECLDEPVTHLNKPPDVFSSMYRQTSDLYLRHLPGFCWLPWKWLEEGGLHRAMRRTLHTGVRVFRDGSSDPRGFAPLCGDLRRGLEEIGVEASSNQILLTNGATGGLDLIGRYLTRPDDVVLIDDPGYFRAFGHMQALGVIVKGVPWTCAGPDLEQLEIAAKKYSPRLFVTSPIIQNPTGGSISRGTAFQLLQLAERYDFYIVEDDVLGVLHPDPPPRLASLDQLNRVIYVNSFSKVLAPWLRVGYLAGDRDLVRDLVEMKVLTQPTTPELSERLVHEVLTDGRFRKHLTNLRSKIERTRNIVSRNFESIGFGPCFDGTHGPYAWMEVPGVTDTALLAKVAMEHRMLLAPGAMFRPDLTPSMMMRFNVGFCKSLETLRLLEALLNVNDGA